MKQWRKSQTKESTLDLPVPSIRATGQGSLFVLKNEFGQDRKQDVGASGKPSRKEEVYETKYF